MIHYSKNITKINKNFGGKANNLIISKQLGLKIPDFLIIPSDYLASLISEINGSKGDFIDDFNFDNDFLNKITHYFENETYYAVRSSALNEDGKENSFAGLYESALFVNKEMLNDALKKVWKSAYDNIVLIYEKHNNLQNLGIAIIVQNMIDADVSGVAFAINPINYNTNETFINAIWGLGEGIVSENLDADLYKIENNTIKYEIANKEQGIYFNSKEKFGTQKAFIKPERAKKQCLTDNQIFEIEKLVKKVSKHFNHPQDIEFAIEKNTIYLLQTRPITVISKPKEGNYTIWDNSNIIESYPGLTLPLTYSYIIKMYEVVNLQLSLLLGINKKTIEKNKKVYENMLGLLCGRVYYQLNHWHKILSFLPGYSYNKEFMDKMMGVKEKFDIEKINTKNKWVEYFNIFISIINILKQLIFVEKERIKFLKFFDNLLKEYQSINFNSLTLKELLIKYLYYEKTLVTKWKAPFVNDFFCMIYFGILQKLVVKYQLHKNGALHNDLISGARDIISTEPIILTNAIVELILKNKKINNLFLAKEVEIIYSELKNDEFLIIYNAIENYIEKWGDRCVGELKLETTTYKQKPEKYIEIP